MLADHTKWGVIGIASIARLDQADVLVSDTGLDAVAQETLRDAVGELILVPSTRTIDAGPGRRPVAATTTSGGHRPPAVPTDDRPGPPTRRSRRSRGSPTDGATR